MSESRSPLLLQVDSLPKLLQLAAKPFIASARQTLSQADCGSFESVYLVGCGDSYHAALASELAFEQLAGLPSRAMPAMQFSRYKSGFLPAGDEGSPLVIAISASGQVSRTIEALKLARKAGAVSVALTGDRGGPLAQESELILDSAVPPLATESSGMTVPGCRTYLATLTSLFAAAIQIGLMRGRLQDSEVSRLFYEMAMAAELMEQTIRKTDPLARSLADRLRDADQFVFCGAGPNYGTALFSAAKVLEASGDHAVGQDTEEWAHLQYFARQSDTPTFLISAGGWDEDRALEIATAARSIGRRLVIIAPEGSDLGNSSDGDELLYASGSIGECFSPLLTCLPAILFAAHLAEVTDEPYFRGFAGGRSIEGGGGISRIRTSNQIKEPRS